MNVYKVTDDDGVYVFVAAANRRDAMSRYPTDEAKHCYLVEEDTEFFAGDLTTEYEHSRGVDLIMSGVIQPNWFNALHAPEYDDYRGWNGFVATAPAADAVTV